MSRMERTWILTWLIKHSVVLKVRHKVVVALNRKRKLLVVLKWMESVFSIWSSCGKNDLRGSKCSLVLQKLLTILIFQEALSLLSHALRHELSFVEIERISRNMLHRVFLLDFFNNVDCRHTKFIFIVFLQKLKMSMDPFFASWFGARVVILWSSWIRSRSIVLTIVGFLRNTIKRIWDL